MAWTLKGSYAETCSCELMCPCNLSFDHGATYDFCRATLAFHVREGDIERTDVGLRHGVRVGDAIDFEIEDIVPFGVETGEPVRFANMFHPAGSALTMAEARRSQIDAFGIAYEGKTGLSTSEFSWAA